MRTTNLLTFIVWTAAVWTLASYTMHYKLSKEPSPFKEVGFQIVPPPVQEESITNSNEDGELKLENALSPFSDFSDLIKNSSISNSNSKKEKKNDESTHFKDPLKDSVMIEVFKQVIFTLSHIVALL